MMIRKAVVDEKSLYFILIRQNRVIAYIQRGQADDDVILQLFQEEMEKAVMDEIKKILLVEPDSAYMNSTGVWEYRKEYCFHSANLYGFFLWAYFDPGANTIKCGFDFNVEKKSSNN